MKTTFVGIIIAMFWFFNFLAPGLEGGHRRIIKVQPPTELTICGSQVNNFLELRNGKFISILPGWGHHHYHISSRIDSTQRYFDQGLSFYFSYHFREALASFREAARFDSSSSMAYWGQALAMGPYYNSYYYKLNKDVLGVVKAMTMHQATANEREKELIVAMQTRYSSDTSNSDRILLDSTYSVSLRRLVARFDSDDDIKALYIDAMMLRHKWDFWTVGGQPKPWTPELIGLCTLILKHEKLHPAGLHYLIHLTEASRDPKQALASANLLKDAMPGVGHMVHMSTHMYQRNGLYTKGVQVNEDANNAANRTASLAPNLHYSRDGIVHIYDVQSFCAMNAGMYVKGMPLYLRARNRLLVMEPKIQTDSHAQAIFMNPVIACVRLGKWKQILAYKHPPEAWIYAGVLDDFAKGLAYVHLNDLAAARSCLKHIKAHQNDSLLVHRQMPFNKPGSCASIALSILQGEILFEEGRRAEAIAALRTAVAGDDQLIYREPSDWLIPARHYLGAYLLKMNKPNEAGKVYSEDLFLNPGNGWSLLGKYKSLVAQSKLTAARAYLRAAQRAFVSADVMPGGSVFF